MPPTPPTDERLVLALPEGEALPVAWHAPFFEYTGYADEARAFVQAASPRWPVHARPLDRGDPSFLATLAIEERRRMEALVGPLKTNNTTVEASFHAFFARSDVRVVAITAAVCDRAARIRATHNFKPMDALQLAAQRYGVPYSDLDARVRYRASTTGPKRPWLTSRRLYG